MAAAGPAATAAPASAAALRYVLAEMKLHHPGGGIVGVRVGLDDHRRELSALVVVAAQRFWVPELRTSWITR
jgi:hypothetical protein